MLTLKPTVQPMPDNSWHMLSIALVATVAVWMGWTTWLNVLEGPEGTTLTHMEEYLQTGSAGGVYGFLETLPGPSLRWNRVLSALGWGFCLWMVGSLVTRLYGFARALPSVLLLVTLPGLLPHMMSAGSGSWACFFFLLMFSFLLLETAPTSWCWAGVWGGLAVVLHPAWALPVVGLLAGTFQVNRPAGIRAAVCVAAAGGGLTLLMGVAFAAAWGWPLSAPVTGQEWLQVGVWDRSSFFLHGVFLLLVGLGASKRGLGWWALITTLPGIWFGFWLTGDLGAGWVPLVVMTAVGLAKLPGLLHIRHPQSYQSVLLCQLLLWLPGHMSRLQASQDPGPEPSSQQEGAVLTSGSRK